ncbi:MAG: hypothetical protein ACRYFK_07535 [Janthinobacterium lividum]
MKLFAKSGLATLAFGAAMLALVGKETVTSEEAEAANGELETAGIKGAQFITEAAFNDLTTKASRTDAAETSAQGLKDALAAAGAADVAALVAQRDGYKVKADKYDKGAGADHTNPTLKKGESDVETAEPDAHQKAIDELPHNKALAGHPLFN